MHVTDGERQAHDPVAGWSRLHGEDVSGSRVVVGWLRFVHLLARRVDRVPPDVLSAAGVVVAAGAVAVVGLVQLAIGIRGELAGRPWVDPAGSGRADETGDDGG